MERDLAPDAREVPAVFVVAQQAPDVQYEAIKSGQLCDSAPTIASIFHGYFPS
jgi:hypothetical protein